MDRVYNPCHTCRFHDGEWQKCKCNICSTTFHQERCVNDNRELHCVFYKEN